MSRPARRLQNRLMLAFSGFSLFVAALFTLYAVAFMYAVEDAFLDSRLEQEATRQLQHLTATGRWGEPGDASMQIHTDMTTLPDDVKGPLEADPSRHEFSGRNGRHYHLKQLDPPAPAARAWLVSEVSGQLVVRPRNRQIFTLLAVSGFLIVAMALLIAYWLARRTAGPLSRLAAQVDGMSPDRLPRSIAIDFRNDEVGVLARGLDALIDRIRAFITREQEFTRDASHELRTPLAVIRSAAERLIAEPGLSTAGRQHLGHMRQSAMQLEQTVTTLLSLAREDQPSDSNAPVAIVPMLERIIVEQSPLLDGKNVTVDLALPRTTCVTYPASAMQILLSNLVGNAFAHTAHGTVRIDIDGGRLRIANSSGDDQPGVPWPSPQPFDKREGSSGFGLGLAIVRRLCDSYGIDLHIERSKNAVIASIPIETAKRSTPGSPSS